MCKIFIVIFLQRSERQIVFLLVEQTDLWKDRNAVEDTLQLWPSLRSWEKPLQFVVSFWEGLISYWNIWCFIVESWNLHANILNIDLFLLIKFVVSGYLISVGISSLRQALNKNCTHVNIHIYFFWSALSSFFWVLWSPLSPECLRVSSLPSLELTLQVLPQDQDPWRCLQPSVV